MAVQYKNLDVFNVTNVAALFNLKVADNQLVQTQGYSKESGTGNTGWIAK